MTILMNIRNRPKRTTEELIALINQRRLNSGSRLTDLRSMIGLPLRMRRRAASMEIGVQIFQTALRKL